MQYNLHPIIVHFPVALLFLYSLIKILPLEKWLPRIAWKQLEVILLTIGTMGALAALYTGEIADDLIRPDENLSEMHSLFGYITTSLYGLLMLLELFSLKYPAIKIFTEGVVPKIVALVALVALIVTGMLGGVMTYGLSADPLAPFVLKILGINY